MITASLLQVIAQEANRTKIQDLFNTTLYTSAGAARTVTNGINLAAHGGLLWERYRTPADQYHAFVDSKRGLTAYILPESPAAEGSDPNYVQSFNSNGFTLVNDYTAGTPVVANTFRIARRFMDIVTYTGNGSARAIAHGLGVAPGMIIVKKRNGATAWRVYHRSLGAGNAVDLNTSAVAATGAANWNSTAPTPSEFSLGTDSAVNGNADTFVAYLFAHDPGGVIQCGSYTGNGSTSGPSVALDWQPQWVIIKRTNTSGGNWSVVDISRGFAAGSDKIITLDTMTAETTEDVADPTSTGFTLKTTSAQFNASGGAYIYMAIKKAP